MHSIERIIFSFAHIRCKRLAMIVICRLVIGSTIFLDEFLDEPIELDVPDPIQIDPALAAEWERRLAESFREDARREAASDDAPKGLYAVRKRRERK